MNNSDPSVATSCRDSCTFCIAGADRSRNPLGLPDHRPSADDLEGRAAVRCRLHRLFAWGAFFLQFWPFYVAGAADPRSGDHHRDDRIPRASRWFLQGVLRVPGKARHELLSAVLILRLVVAGITSYATSNSAMLSMSAATIQQEQQKIRDATNAAKRTAGAGTRCKCTENHSARWMPKWNGRQPKRARSTTSSDQRPGGYAMPPVSNWSTARSRPTVSLTASQAAAGTGAAVPRSGNAAREGG